MKTVVGCLLYADDLLILSETKEGLQHSLDNLYNYCSTWKLQLNVKKTNIVIFSSRQHSSQYDFKFGPLSLRIADTSSYLGITFHKNGNFTEAVTRLKEKSNKAMFSLSQALYSGITFDPKLPLKVFDSTIRPILTYGSEVWCSQYIHLLLKPNQIDKMMFENINNRFCKFIMGLPRQASNFGIKAELGRPPIFSFMCAQLFRYWFKIINVDSDRILKDAYLSELHICNKGGASWVTFVLKLLQVTNLEDLWCKQMGNHKIEKSHVNVLKNNVQDAITKIYHNNEFNNIDHNCKLRTYKKFKSDFKLEKYVNICNVPLSWRKLYCSFRISCHDLEIERGRYIRPYVKPDRRVCKLCLQEAETEEHFITKCHTYQDLRRDLCH